MTLVMARHAEQHVSQELQEQPGVAGGCCEPQQQITMKLLLVPHAAEHVFQELQQQMAGAADVEQARLQEHQGWCWSS